MCLGVWVFVFMCVCVCLLACLLACSFVCLLVCLFVCPCSRVRTCVDFDVSNLVACVLVACFVTVFFHRCFHLPCYFVVVCFCVCFVGWLAVVLVWFACCCGALLCVMGLLDSELAQRRRSI